MNTLIAALAAGVGAYIGTRIGNARADRAWLEVFDLVRPHIANTSRPTDVEINPHTLDHQETP